MRLLLLLLALMLPLGAVAQQGTVVYDETVRLEIELPPEMQHMRDRFPSENTSQRIVQFDGAVSLMKNAPQELEQLEASPGGGRIRMMMAGQADSETYTNHDDAVQIEKRTFLERTFLIRGEPLQPAWRLTGETAEFLGFATYRATATVGEDTQVEAWFTPEIPVPVGPGRYGGLPGLILVLSENDGRRTFAAKEVSLDPLAEALDVPQRGREITREEFDALVAERMQEMGARGGRGGIRFRSSN